MSDFLIRNAYVEITNICNLSCSFCPGHDRKPESMTAQGFAHIASKLDGKIENLFLHLMGEPLLHCELEEILSICDSMNVKLKITTNGTLTENRLPLLSGCKNLRTVCMSLHSFEGNSESGIDFDAYIDSCLSTASDLANAGKFAVLRLWNLDGTSKEKAENSLNDRILEKIRCRFPPEREEWVKNHRGVRVATHVFLEWNERFDWPDITELPKAETLDLPTGEIGNDRCHGLLSQIGILVDGTVVPCCLDRNGDIALGNIYCSSLEDILSSPRAVRMKEAMAHHRFIEPLCIACRNNLGDFWKSPLSPKKLLK